MCIRDRHCDIQLHTETNYPYVAFNSLEFQDVLPLVEKVSPTQYNMWKLCSILFDPIGLSYQVDDPKVKETLLKEKRIKSLTSWIVDQVRDEIRDKISMCDNPLDEIFLHLLMNDVVTATKVASDAKNGHLSVLLLFLGSNDPRIRELAELQVGTWKSNGYQVDPSILKIYELLSGTLLQDNTGLRKLSEEFSWLALLGLSLYYGKVDEYTLEDLILAYLPLFKPNYDDPLYVIFQLFGAQDSTENLFKETQLTSRVLDIQFSWYFIQILKFNKIRQFSSETSDIFSLQFIEELKVGHFNKQALYVSCFISDQSIAKTQIDLLVHQDILQLYNMPNTHILDDLKIPFKLIHGALALTDKYKGDHLSEVRNLLLGQYYDEAEIVFRTIVGPELIISSTTSHNNELNILRDLLEKFPKASMEHWSSGLGVFESYLELALDESTDEAILKNLMAELIIFYDLGKHHNTIPVCCTIISQKIISTILSKYKMDLSTEWKDRMLNLPLGHPERSYLRSELSTI